MSLTIGSLFAGIGGLELGLEMAGLGPTIWQVERDPYCQRVLAKHWPNATRYDDVRTISASNTRRVDVICGGFPCQDISYAGKGAGLSGARSGLWYEFARIVGELGPRYVVVENVAALLDRGMGDVLGTLAALGYDATWDCISAASVGAPHQRDRIFIVASNRDNEVSNANGERLRDQSESESWRLDSTVADAHGAAWSLARCELHERTRALADADGRWHESQLDANAAHDSTSNDRRLCRSDGRRDRARASEAREGTRALADAEGVRLQGRIDEDRLHLTPSTKRLLQSAGETHGDGDPWASEPDVGRVAHGVPSRVDRLRALGNAVVPQCARVVGEHIRQIVEGGAR